MVVAKRKWERVLDLPCAVCNAPVRDHPDGKRPFADDHQVELSEEGLNKLNDAEVNYWVRWVGGCVRVTTQVSRCLAVRNQREQNGVQNNKAWQRACGLTPAVFEGVRVD